MLGHLNYNFKYIKSRTSTWVLLGLYVTVVFLSYILAPYLTFLDFSDQNKNHASYIAIITTTGSLVGIVLSLLAASKAVNIFKDPENDGTELIFLAKPITRKTILFSKLTFFWMLMFAYILVALPLVIIGSAVFGGNVGLVVVGYLINNFFTILVFGSIAILISSAVNAVGTLLIQFGLAVLLFLIIPNIFRIPSVSKIDIIHYFDIGNQLQYLITIGTGSKDLEYARKIVYGPQSATFVSPPYWASILIATFLGSILHLGAAYIFAERDFS